MPRNRIIYNTQALYVSQVPATEMQTGNNDIKQLSRIQNFDEDFVRNYTNIFQYGTLGSIGVLETEDPTVSANFSYYLTNGWNEKLLGFEVYPNESPDNYIGEYKQAVGFPILKNEIKSCISNFVTKTADEKNYYLLISEEGIDAVNYNVGGYALIGGYYGTTSNKSGVIGIGNAYVTSYTVSAAVGDIPTAEVEIEGLNVRVYDKLLYEVSGFSLEEILKSPSGLGFGDSLSMDWDSNRLATASNTSIFLYQAVGDGWNRYKNWELFQTIGGYRNSNPIVAIKDNLLLVSYPYETAGMGAIISIYDRNNLTNQFVQRTIIPANSASDLGNSLVIADNNNYFLASERIRDRVIMYTGSPQIWDAGGVIGGYNYAPLYTFTGISGSRFGEHVSATPSFETIVIGAGLESTGWGAVYVYTGNKDNSPIKPSGNWSFKQKLTGFSTLPIATSWGFGTAISDNGRVIAIGGYGGGAGSILLFTGSYSDSWSLKQTLGPFSGCTPSARNLYISPDANFIAMAHSCNRTIIYSGNVSGGWYPYITTSGSSQSTNNSPNIQSKSFNINGKTVTPFIIGASLNNQINIFNLGLDNIYGERIPAINYVNGANLVDKFFNLPAARSITGGIDVIYPWAIGGYIGGYREIPNIPISIDNPINKIPSVLLPGDIVFNIPESGVLGFDSNDLKIQDFTLSLDLARTPVKRIGNRFAISREINFPATATLEINAEIGDLSNDNLVDFLCNEKLKDFNISIKKPGCGLDKSTSITYLFRNARLVSQNISATIGENGTITATYEVPLGGPTNTNRGVFISGSYVNNCPITGNAPWVRWSLYNQGGVQFPISGQFTGLTDTLNTYQFSNFVAQNPVQRRLAVSSPITWEGFSNILTGWIPNTGFINVGSGGYVEILTTGFWAGFGIEWWSSNKLPSQLTSSEKAWTETQNFTNIFLQQLGDVPRTNSLQVSSTPYIGYLPLNHNYLYFRLNPSAGGGSLFITATTSSGYYNMVDSENGACYQNFTQPVIPNQNIVQFLDYTSYNIGIDPIMNLLIRYTSGIVAVDYINSGNFIMQSNTNYTLQ